MKGFFFAALGAAFLCLALGVVFTVKVKSKTSKLLVAAASLGVVALWLAFALCLGFFMTESGV